MAGDRVLAIGWPFGVLTVTQGIVGAINRPDPDGKGLVEFIQTDAAVNPGAAGGALIDTQGRVVGVTAATIGGAPGASLAIPSNFARLAAEDLISTGKARRWSLGAAVSNITAEQRAMGLRGGVTVVQVAPGGIADKAGILAGDIILEFDSQTVRDSGQLRFIVASTPPDRKVVVTLLHDDEKTRKAGEEELWRSVRSVTLSGSTK
jgi:serine protease Do